MYQSEKIYDWFFAKHLHHHHQFGNGRRRQAFPSHGGHHRNWWFINVNETEVQLICHDQSLERRSHNGKNAHFRFSNTWLVLSNHKFRFGWKTITKEISSRSIRFSFFWSWRRSLEAKRKSAANGSDAKTLTWIRHGLRKKINRVLAPT